MRITRKLIAVGAAIDGVALLLYLILTKDVTVDHAPLSGCGILLAIGLATIGVIGACSMLAGLVIHVVVARSHSFAEGVRQGVRESVEAWVGQLMKALPDQPDNVRELRPRDDYPRRP